MKKSFQEIKIPLVVSSDMTENTFSETPEDIKPNVTFDEVKAALSNLYGLTGGHMEQLHGYDDLNFHFKPECSCNPFVKTLCHRGYIVKIMNSLDSLKPGLCEAQNELLLFLRKHDIPSPKPIQTITGDYYATDKFPKTRQHTSKVHIIRVFEFEQGTILARTPKSYPLFYNLGKFLAQLNEVLKEFSHPVYEVHKSEWHLNSAPEVTHYSGLVDTHRKKEMVCRIIEKFTQDVQTKMGAFEKGIIHGDFNENNVLMAQNLSGNWEVSAILDFGDSHKSYYLHELAIAMCYMMIECKKEGLDLIEGTGHLLAGYLSIRPDFLLDYSLLKNSISARICQSLVLGLKAFSIQPGNKYVLQTQEIGWQILEDLWEMSEEQVAKTWDSVIQSYRIKHESNNSS